MISLNLLPPERKESFYWMKNTKKVIRAGLKSILLLVCFSLPLIAINIYLSGEVKTLDIKIDSIENTTNVRELNSVEKSFKSVNGSLGKINNIVAEQIYWSDILGKITTLTPAEVQVFSLDVASDGKFIVIGKAREREDVLEFGKTLKNSPDFKDVQTPLDNITKNIDIDFKFTGTIILDNFKAKEKIKMENVGQI